ncbi:DUF2946 family protein [Limnohabitans sp. G3-2]|uniref:DUF2946 family protein n=1 Tax=Limnohabitans sp. G3-2 TaxID=1100711 RepID=UPI00117B2F03
MNSACSRLPRWLNILLLGALLWSPLWGQWHGIAHGTGHALSASVERHEGHVLAEPGQDEHRHEGHLDDLGHDADSDLCRVLDHLSQAERLSASCSPGLAPMGTTAPPIFRLAFSSDRDRWSPAQARAPPVLI